jgi:ParB-like chromosome segregation protein Spo0J
MSSAPVSTAWRNRIVRSGDAALAEIQANPANWRTHPKAQADALAGVLGEVGYVQQVVINARSGRLVDGHLRLALAEQHGESSVPAVWVDLDDAEERLILATLDPLAAMAETDAAALAALLAEVSPSDDALRSMLADLAASITPTLPTPSEQAEPVLRSECLIEIRCTNDDRDDFAPMLDEWRERDGVQIDIS